MATDSLPAAGHVACGVDGSNFAQHAVDWAADEVVLRGIDLRLLHAWEPMAFEPHKWCGGLGSGLHPPKAARPTSSPCQAIRSMTSP
ncbi:universal stress protein [Yinghuangia sp. YIM S09857]|uniref:universal stress protein n=1 Tax=Yinghuangia sp. YIM S09857 TaxID=3436929 RepID=UPI003F52C239